MTALRALTSYKGATHAQFKKTRSRRRGSIMKVPLRNSHTDVESFVVALLTKEKELAYEELLSRVAEFLYRKELRAGAWAVDIGLFGSSLFIPEAERILREAKDELWELV